MKIKSNNSHLKLGVLGAAALVTGGLLVVLAPEAQTMRDPATGTNRSTHSADKNDPHRDMMGNPTRTISGSIPVSRTTTAPEVMREPMTTGDTRR